MHRTTHKGTSEVWFYYMRSPEETENMEESWKREIWRLYLVKKGSAWDAEKVLEVQSGYKKCWIS